jgi:ribosome biogenesis protein Tsr3
MLSKRSEQMKLRITRALPRIINANPVGDGVIYSKNTL